LEKNLSQCHFVHKKWTDPEANLGVRGERPATNNQSHGTDSMKLDYDDYVNGVRLYL
jgi:hypothetical protein